MFETKEYIGVWYLPDEPDKSVVGTLTFSQNEGIKLSLMGELGNYFNKDSSEYETIIGIASGNHITLKKCLRTNLKISVPGIKTSEYTASYILEGVHIEDVQDENFKEVRVRFSNINEWIALNSIREDYKEEDNTSIITCMNPESIKFCQNDYLSVSVGFGYEINGQFYKETTITQSNYFDISLTEDTSFDSITKLLYKIQNLITLLIGTASYVTFQEIKYKDNWIKVYYKIPFLPRDHNAIHPAYMLISFFDIYNINNNFLDQWLSRYELIKPVFDAYYTIYNDKMYLEQQMLSLVQGLETYHRRAIRNYELSDEEHEKRVKSVIDAADEQYKKWLQDKLTFSNEPNLRKRMNEIWSSFNGILTNFFNRKTRDYYIDKIVATRNYNVHYNEDLADRALKGFDLYKLNVLLGIFYKIILMREIGIFDEHILTILQRNHSFLQQIKLLSN
ncbi:ApeA N-terminal domain 1-containing protein [Paenibacillus tyrfis]|uniref:ApeA N-terminal domain 1-containing protein n=1 Tax=Paenibacillus tyrfis TaxID=1501230 RepID=UPI000B594E91|nr:HEPN domain-containing protein [Paenibacillus tyrfis]